MTAAITQVFQMTTDLQRTTAFGDLNCQKLFGIVTDIYGLFSSLEALRGFRKDCGLKSDNPEWSRGSDVDGILIDTGEDVKVNVRVVPGVSFILLWCAVWLKVVDIVCHLIVPTPRNKQIHPKPTDKENTDFDAYMLLAVKDKPEKVHAVEEAKDDDNV